MKMYQGIYYTFQDVGHKVDIPNENLESNPAYEICSLKPTQITVTSNSAYHTRHEVRQLANYPTELTTHPEGLYEYIK